jgi:hypothetical protein
MVGFWQMDLAVVGFWQMEVALQIEKKGVKKGFEFCLAFSLSVGTWQASSSSSCSRLII